MTTDQIIYFVFGLALVAALIADLGLLSKKGKVVSIRQALMQTFFWVGLALAFFVFLWLEKGPVVSLQYLSGYLMEWSLSIDNIFVFILIFTAFSVREKFYGRVLLAGILMAILFRVVFITVGVALVDRFEWLLYIFGAFLIYTGYKMFVSDEDSEFNPQESKVFRQLQKWLPLVPHDGEGRYRVKENGKTFYTTLFVVVMMLAAIDLVFALDSIPAVMGISRDKMVIYTSNIFAVLGLRSLFFLLRGAINRFDYLPQGIAIVLVFIGIKMLTEHWIEPYISKNNLIFISLGMIAVCISGSIFYSIFMDKRKKLQEADEDPENLDADF